MPRREDEIRKRAVSNPDLERWTAFSSDEMLALRWSVQLALESRRKVGIERGRLDEYLTKLLHEFIEVLGQ
jgi:hypothetical protein